MASDPNLIQHGRRRRKKGYKFTYDIVNVDP